MNVPTRTLRSRVARPLVLALMMLVTVGALAVAQTPPAWSGRLSLGDAVALGLANAPRVRVGRADTLAATALIAIARSRQNPVLSGSYSKAPPNFHATIDLPLDLPSLRRLRSSAASASLEAARAQFGLTRAETRYFVESAYAAALRAHERATLSRETLRGADSLVAMTVARRDAGDASDLDVELAQVEAAQLASAYAEDSARITTTILDLAKAMGLPEQRPSFVLVDSLAPLADAAIAQSRAPSGATTSGSPLRIAAAAATLRAQEQSLILARRRTALVPSLLLGFDVHDPSFPRNQLLPVVGFSVPLPFLNRYQGDIALADAMRERAQVELDAARWVSSAEVVQARADLRASAARIERGRGTAQLARRVAEKALVAFSEGEAALPYVLQAQRSARDALAQLTDAEATAAVAGATLRLLLTPES